MLQQLSRSFLNIAVAAILAAGSAVAQQAAQGPKPKDQGEYDLYNSILGEKDPNKRLGLLDQWKSKYADTDFKKERLLFFMNTYRELNQGVKMADACEGILLLDPKDVNALYWRTLLVKSLPVTPDNLDKGEKAAQGLAAASRPDAVPDATWKQLNTTFVGTETMGYVASARKDLEGAAKHYKKALELNPNAASVSYALGSVILNQKKPELYSEMLYHIARATAITGPGELQPTATKSQVTAFLKKTYTAYHGSEEGLKELVEMARANPMPPADLKIKSKHEIEAENAEKFAKDNPQLALWKTVKDKLMAADGQQYFDGELKGSAVPKLRGTIISTKPALRPKEVVLGIEKPDAPEVTLVLAAAMPGKADPGTAIEFEGVPSEFTKEPFMLKFDVEGKDKISGWPAPPPPVKKAPAAKKAGVAKKK